MKSRIRDRVGSRGWARATVAAWFVVVAAIVAVQAATHDFLPPRVSLSQYGVGPAGWLFSVFGVAIAAGGLTGYAARGERDARIWVLLGAGAVGALTMAAVRTDADGSQHSAHARIHLFGAVLSLVALPLGCWWPLRRRSRTVAGTATVLLLGSGVALLLLLLAAAGVDTAFGVGAPAAWALWQSVAVVLDVLLLGLVALVGLRIRPPTHPPVRPGLAQGHPPVEPPGLPPAHPPPAAREPAGG